MAPSELLDRISAGAVRNVRFSDLRRLVLALGFRSLRVRGSHHIFGHPDVAELINLQDVSGQAKPYQVRQLLRIVEVCSEVGGQRLNDRYHINVSYSEEDGGYIADIPDLEACSAFGKTPEEALHEVIRAKDAWLAAARASGKPVPDPHYRPTAEAR